MRWPRRRATGTALPASVGCMLIPVTSRFLSNALTVVESTSVVAVLSVESPMVRTEEQRRDKMVQARVSVDISGPRKSFVADVDVVVGCFFGDEGKGQVAKWLADKAEQSSVPYTWTARVGAQNAEHRITHQACDLTCRIFPSAAACRDIVAVLGAGHCFMPDHFFREAVHLGIPLERVYVDPHAMWLREEHATTSIDTANARGSTGWGIGAAVAEKVRRKPGTRTIGDCEEIQKALGPRLTPIPRLLQDMDGPGLFEGSQGALLSLDHGHFPYCLHEHTQVLTPIGFRSLKDIREGDTVWDGGGWTGVLCKWESKKAAYEVSVGGNSLICSAGHTHIVWRGGSCVAVRTSELVVGDIMETPATIPPVCDSLRCDSLVSDYFLYLCGYMIGDGHITDTEIGRNVTASFTGNDLSSVQRALTAVGVSSTVRPHTGNCRRIRVGNRSRVVRPMQAMGLHKRHYDVGLPLGFTSMDQMRMGALLAGLVDSDGIVANRRGWGTRISIRVSSLALVSQLQSWFRINGLRTSVAWLPVIKRTAKALSVQEQRGYRNTVYRFDVVLDSRFTILAKQLVTYSRKINSVSYGDRREVDPLKMAGIASRYHRRDYRNPSRSVPVVSSVVRYIRPLGTDENMVDIETGSHMFVANGVVTHNCTAKNVTVPAICGELGIGHRRIRKVIGVTRVVMMRVPGPSGPVGEGCVELTYDDVEARTGLRLPHHRRLQGDSTRWAASTKGSQAEEERLFDITINEVYRSHILNNYDALVVTFVDYHRRGNYRVRRWQDLHRDTRDLILEIDREIAPVILVRTGQGEFDFIER